MTIATDRPPEAPEYRPYRDAALKFVATGRTPERVRANAADGEVVQGVVLSALRQGLVITPAAVREEMLAIATAMDEVLAEGLTPVQAYYEAALDQFLGPFPGVPSPRAASGENDTPDCPGVTDGGSHSIAWHEGGECAFCHARASVLPRTAPAGAPALRSA